MMDEKIRRGILDLATEDYMPLWVLARSIRPAETEETIRRVVHDMLRDGALGMFRGDHFIGEETAVTEPREIEALLNDAVNWQPSPEPPRVMVLSTDEGNREYYSGIPERSDAGTRWSDPQKGGADGVRIMPGNPGDPTPVKRGPYVRVRRNGVETDPIPLAGNPELPS